MNVHHSTDPLLARAPVPPPVEWPADFEADLAYMAATRTGWAAVPESFRAFSRWLETEAGQAWLEQEAARYDYPEDAFEVTDCYCAC